MAGMKITWNNNHESRRQEAEESLGSMAGVGFRRRPLAPPAGPTLRVMERKCSRPRTYYVGNYTVLFSGSLYMEKDRGGGKHLSYSNMYILRIAVVTPVQNTQTHLVKTSTTTFQSHSHTLNIIQLNINGMKTNTQNYSNYTTNSTYT